jgi:hypothetical protein
MIYDFAKGTNKSSYCKKQQLKKAVRGEPGSLLNL